MSQLLRVLLVSSLFFLLSTLDLFTPGQFMDGATYASISRNLSQGLGSYWDLFYTPHLYPHFIEHPPLFFGIQSLFFSFLGDYWYTEDIMGLFLWVITALGIDRICRWSGLSSRGTQWALIFWTIVPVVSWSFGNNLLETLVSPLTVWSVALSIYGMRRKQSFTLALTGILIIGAFLTKGPVGLFPLAFPFFWHITSSSSQKFRFLIRDSLFVLIGALLTLGIILLSKDAIAVINSYWAKQIVKSILNITTVETRFYIVIVFLLQLALPLLLALIIRLFNKGLSPNKKTLSRSLTFGLFSLCAILPMIVSLKQSDFYSTPAYPFAAISIAFYIERCLIQFNRIKPRIFFQIIISFFAIGILLRLLPFVQDHRDLQLRESIEYHANQYRGDTVFVNNDLFTNWSLHANCARIGQIYLSNDKNNIAYPNLIQKKNGRIIITP
jgi:4-amino-4-deoxy-L-arabinose transferase-like glycosyltransferase|tara:strand:- start:7299 stop:8618 length:1320 start_codon:yes stop_codon:yes gene_type:complete